MGPITPCMGEVWLGHISIFHPALALPKCNASKVASSITTPWFAKASSPRRRLPHGHCTGAVDRLSKSKDITLAGAGRGVSSGWPSRTSRRSASRLPAALHSLRTHYLGSLWPGSPLRCHLGCEPYACGDRWESWAAAFFMMQSIRILLTAQPFLMS